MRPLALAALLLTPSALGQPVSQPAPPAAPTHRDISASLDPILAKHKVPGMAAAAVLDGKIIASGCAGVRELGKPDKVALTDLWHLGSCTKAMTATLAAVLVEKGEVAWEDTLGGTFPDLAMKDAWKPATLRQLTTNHGGVPTSLDKDGLWARLWAFKGTPTDARLELLKAVARWDPEAAPGTKFIYSNGGFAIAGAMLEKKSGKPWEDLLQDRLFRPLGITSAGFGAPGTRGTVDQPRGHRGGKAIPPGPGSDNPVAIGPAGIVHMTIEDWARFCMAHADGESVPKDASGIPAATLLKPDTWKLLHTPYKTGVKGEKDDYAAGWVVATRPWAKGRREGDTGRVLNHSGSNTMWFCVAWVAPERRFAVVVATNQGDGEAPRAADDAAAALIRELLKP